MALCGWCRSELPATARNTQAFCGKLCRQTAWRARKVSLLQRDDGCALRVAYADPPYPGTARKYYQHEPSYRGEVDHAELLLRLQAYDGWALSTSQKALRDVLPLSPAAARVAAWVKPIGAAPATRGPHNTWEPVIYLPARWRRPGRRDWLSAMPARGGGILPGRKPLKFCLWLFELLGMAPGDQLDDLFPGTGVVTRCWQASSPSPGDADLDLEPATPSPEYSRGAVAQSSSRRVVAGAGRRLTIPSPGAVADAGTGDGRATTSEASA